MEVPPGDVQKQIYSPKRMFQAATHGVKHSQHKVKILHPRRLRRRGCRIFILFFYLIYIFNLIFALFTFLFIGKILDVRYLWHPPTMPSALPLKKRKNDKVWAPSFIGKSTWGVLPFLKVSFKSEMFDYSSGRFDVKWPIYCIRMWNFNQCKID